MKKDRIFKKKDSLGKFNFGRKTAAVFDDMLNRSVPLYGELQRMIGEIASEFARDSTNIYDLGCSTGITLMTIDRTVAKKVKLIGVDYSKHMLDKCCERLKREKINKNYELINRDLNTGISIDNASVVILNLTLQFVKPPYREHIIRSIHHGLVKGGCLVFIEKVLGNDSLFNSLFVKFYYQMKERKGYSKMEIARKRKALKNILIPYRLDENKDLLMRNGFSSPDLFYKWYNFSGLLAIK